MKMVGVAAQSLAKLTRYWAHPIITHMLIMSLVAGEPKRETMSITGISKSLDEPWIGARSSANELSLILQIDNERTGLQEFSLSVADTETASLFHRHACEPSKRDHHHAQPSIRSSAFL